MLVGVLALVAMLGADGAFEPYLSELRAVLNEWPVLTRTGFYLCLLGVLFLLEIWLLGFANSSLGVLLAGNQSGRVDLWVAGLEIFRVLPVMLAFFTVGADPLFQTFSGGLFSQSALHGFHPWVHFLLWFLLMDLLEYFYHRLAHRVGVLWEAHKYHHAAAEFTILTGSRIHVLEHFGRHLFTAIPMAWIGVPVGDFFSILLLRRAIDMLQHSRFDWDYGWVGRWLVYSPRDHRIHHSPEREHWDKNFGDILVIWDRLFGTWYDGKHINQKVDVSNNPYHQQAFWRDYLRCYWRCATSFWRSLRTGQWLERYPP